MKLELECIGLISKINITCRELGQIYGVIYGKYIGFYGDIILV